MKKVIVFFLILLAAFRGLQAEVWAEEEVGSLLEEMQKELLDQKELQKVQMALDELLKEDSFSFFDVFVEWMHGDTKTLKQKGVARFKKILFRQLFRKKELLVQIVILVFLEAFLTNFTGLFAEGQIGEVSFYSVYLLLFTLMIKGFGKVSLETAGLLQGLNHFMKVLAPAYGLTIAAAGGMMRSSMFYQLVLFVITFVQRILLGVILPGINAYVLLSLVNLISKEDIMSRMAGLVHGGIIWVMKTLVTIVISFQAVQRLIAPAVDSLKQSVLGQTAAAIPGIGNAINAVTEVMLGTAVLIRNCMGVTAMVVLVLAGSGPLIRMGLSSVYYHMLEAVVQPVSDRRVVGALGAVGEGYGLMLRLLFTAELLFLLTIALLAGSLV